MKSFLSALHDVLLSCLISTCIVMTIYLLATIAAQNVVKIHDNIRHGDAEIASRVAKV